jgi:hypothetical protein
VVLHRFTVHSNGVDGSAIPRCGQALKLDLSKTELQYVTSSFSGELQNPNRQPQTQFGHSKYLWCTRNRESAFSLKTFVH